MKQFRLYNNIVGWFTFAIAAVTYLMTIEPTGSFWDCGEFISSAYRLEVGHPPGAPFFMLTGRIFSLFASDPSHVAAMVNSMSALCSAFTILFLFWTITHIGRRVVERKNEDMSVSQMVAILGAGFVGALAYTFSDTFWFSAVEGEVYAYSSLFTAVVFWCILKWEDSASKPTSARWLILIAYLMGLSIGVHLLNLLAIPAMVLVYYFKNYEITTKNTIYAIIASVLILAAVLYGMVPGFVEVASWFELLFVNTFGLPFNSGMVAYIICTVALLVWAIYETQYGKNELRMKISFFLAVTIVGIPFIGSNVFIGILVCAAIGTLLFVRKKWNRYWLNIIVMCMTVMLIGYSSYALLVVRSMANPPMDQNSPEDPFTLQSYLNREQYGDTPLFYGAMYSAPEILKIEGNMCVPVIKEGAKIWQRKVKDTPEEKDRYVSMGRKMKGYEVDSRFKMLFPRMHSSNPNHVEAYKSWADIKGKRITVDRCGNPEVRVMPTFGENLKFFFSYQINYMYWRYFMWNFAGRQNDIQGHGEIDKGNWISGIPFIDNALYGDQTNLPDDLKNNRGRNTYFMLPLLLGVLGLLWQLSRKGNGVQMFWVVFTLFFMTGLAIVVYLNQTPYQPRERDYAYAGSFYAFAIWIGLGVMFLYELISKFSPKVVAAIVATLLSLGVPVLMAQQNWDDHDRSNRTVARDMGSNYLNSCAPNAIYFCNGDNDTFPVWYNLEVEGNRTDVRACNLSYLSTDWYIDQMKRGAYESAPLPISWEQKDYVSGHLEVSRVIDHPQFGGKLDLRTALALMRDSRFIDEEGIGTIFAKTLVLPVDKEQVLRTGTVAPEDSNLIVDQMEIKMRGSLNKSQLMMLEMLLTNNWERPMYVATTVGEEFYPMIGEYMQLEGLCYRIVPIKSPKQSRIATDIMYDNVMNKFKWGNMDDPNVYLDEVHLRSCFSLRGAVARLANELIREGKNDKARNVLDVCLEKIPSSCVPFDSYYSMMLADAYYALGDMEKGNMIINDIAEHCIQNLEWATSLPIKQQRRLSAEMSPDQNARILNNLLYTAYRFKSELKDELESEMSKYIQYIQR